MCPTFTARLPCCSLGFQAASGDGPMGGGFPPKQQRSTTSPGHIGTHWTPPEMSWTSPGASWIPFGRSWAPLDIWGHIQNTSRNVQVKMHHLQVMPLGSCRHDQGDPWRKLGCVASGWLRAVGPAAGVTSWEASAQLQTLHPGKLPTQLQASHPSAGDCILGSFE